MSSSSSSNSSVAVLVVSETYFHFPKGIIIIISIPNVSSLTLLSLSPNYFHFPKRIVINIIIIIIYILFSLFQTHRPHRYYYSNSHVIIPRACARDRQSTSKWKVQQRRHLPGGHIKLVSSQQDTCEPVWPSGKALGWQAEGLRFESASALLSLQKLWSVNTILWLCPSQLMKH